MVPPLFVARAQKSVGLAFLLTFLFGPLGLFYSSIVGGLVMTILPIIAVLVLMLGIASDQAAAVLLSLGALLIFWAVNWVVSMVWAVVAASAHNRAVRNEEMRQLALWSAHQPSPSPQVVVIQQEARTDNNKSPETVVARPPLPEWLKANPGKSIHDYFVKFGR